MDQADHGFAQAAPRLRVPLTGLRGVVPCLFGVVVLLAVLWIAGRPSVFADTEDYVVDGRALAINLQMTEAPQRLGAGAATTRLIKVFPDPTILGARTPAYGFPLWALSSVGTLWLVSAVQAGIGAWLIWVAWRTFARGAPRWTAYAVQGVAALLTPLPFYAGFAMPDVFCGYLVLAVCILMSGWSRIRPIERMLLIAISAYAMTLHGSNPPIAVAAAIVGAWLAWRAEADRRALAAGSVAFAIALCLGLFGIGLLWFGEAVALHSIPGRPPFITARLLADGPGRVYLHKACAAGAPYALCRYDAERLDDSETILWDSTKGVFVRSPPEVRCALQHEELTFARDVMASDPAGVLKAAAANTVEQLGEFWTKEPLADQRLFLVDPFFSRSDLPPLLRAAGSCDADRAQCGSKASVAPLKILDGIALALSLLAMAILLSRRRLGAPESWRNAACAVFTALFVNAFVCGALSGPFPRYEARLVWLIPVMAAIGLSQLGVMRPGPAPAAAAPDPADR